MHTLSGKFLNFLYLISELFRPVRAKSVPWIKKRAYPPPIANSWLYHCKWGIGGRGTSLRLRGTEPSLFVPIIGIFRSSGLLLHGGGTDHFRGWAYAAGPMLAAGMAGSFPVRSPEGFSHFYFRRPALAASKSRPHTIHPTSRRALDSGYTANRDTETGRQNDSNTASSVCNIMLQASELCVQNR